MFLFDEFSGWLSNLQEKEQLREMIVRTRTWLLQSFGRSSFFYYFSFTLVK